MLHLDASTVAVEQPLEKTSSDVREYSRNHSDRRVAHPTCFFLHIHWGWRPRLVDGTIPPKLLFVIADVACSLPFHPLKPEKNLPQARWERVLLNPNMCLPSPRFCLRNLFAAF